MILGRQKNAKERILSLHACRKGLTKPLKHRRCRHTTSRGEMRKGVLLRSKNAQSRPARE